MEPQTGTIQREKSPRAKPSLVRNPLSYFGLLLAILSFIALGFLLIIEFNTGHTSPYIGILTYMALPALLVLGLLLVPVGMGLENRRRRRLASVAQEGGPPPLPRIDLNLPRHQRLFTLWAAGTLLVLMMLGTVSYNGFEFMESTTFCAQVCHQVMRPEAVAYQDSPHARVTCTACHIGPGASWYVRSKLSGVGQVLAVLRHSYPQPIATPIENLRPARETCEECHWPEKFYGDQLITRPHFAADEQNTDRSVSLVVKTGGGSDRTGISMGIHWHMDIRNKIRYVAGDERRQSIVWVSATGLDGQTTEYFSTDHPISQGELAGAEQRQMDCLDCHNRPTHHYYMPDQAVDRAIAAGQIDRGLPFVKKTALDLVSRDYASADEAKKQIVDGMTGFYQSNYPQVFAEKQDAIAASAAAAADVWSRNVFPEMKISWGTYPDNIGHRNSPGCFRCHDGKHVSKDGKVIRQECNICHSIPVPSSVARSPAAADFAGQLLGEGNQPTWQSIGKGLHQAPVHKTFPCVGCHSTAGWAIQGRDTCLACHQDKVQHKAGGSCQTCHSFKQ